MCFESFGRRLTLDMEANFRSQDGQKCVDVGEFARIEGDELADISHTVRSSKLKEELLPLLREVVSLPIPREAQLHASENGRLAALAVTEFVERQYDGVILAFPLERSTDEDSNLCSGKCGRRASHLCRVCKESFMALR